MSDQTPTTNQLVHSSVKSFGRHMVMAGVGSALSKTVMSPLERVKLLLQLQATSTQIAKDNQYKGSLFCCLLFIGC